MCEICGNDISIAQFLLPLQLQTLFQRFRKTELTAEVNFTENRTSGHSFDALGSESNKIS